MIYLKHLFQSPFKREGNSFQSKDKLHIDSLSILNDKDTDLNTIIVGSFQRYLQHKIQSLHIKYLLPQHCYEMKATVTKSRVCCFGFFNSVSTSNDTQAEKQLKAAVQSGAHCTENINSWEANSVTPLKSMTKISLTSNWDQNLTQGF